MGAELVTRGTARSGAGGHVDLCTGMSEQQRVGDRRMVWGKQQAASKGSAPGTLLIMQHGLNGNPPEYDMLPVQPIEPGLPLSTGARALVSRPQPYLFVIGSSSLCVWQWWHPFHTTSTALTSCLSLLFCLPALLYTTLSR
ncbi:unnamed protein product [Closterium sp. NIES-54]